jgi:hypothetical protein
MTSDAVWLTKDGLRREGDEGVDTFVPEDVAGLLGLWHATLVEIDPEYTLGDLCAMLRQVSGIETLSAMLGCDLPAFLEEAKQQPSGGDETPIRYLEVYNVADLSGYEEDPGNPDEPPRWLDGDEAAAHDAVNALIGEVPGFRLVATEVDLITGEAVDRRVLPGRPHGTWAGPYRLRRSCHGWGSWAAAHPQANPVAFEGHIGIELVPMNELAHLPLRYDPRLLFRARRAGSGKRVFEERITITFGELVHAAFGRLGLLGTPEERDECRASIHEQMRHLRRATDAEDEPWR